jgi:IMP dehydrogenase
LVSGFVEFSETSAGANCLPDVFQFLPIRIDLKMQCLLDENVEMFKKCDYPGFVSIGCSEKDLERAEALRDAGADLFCVDVAHAHARYVGKTLKSIRRMLGEEACIMAGNVATYAGADHLASCSADIVKVGIGGGSVCTRRLKTGFGVPNLTAIKNCARVDRSIVADGGIRYPGDIVQALSESCG